MEELRQHVKAAAAGSGEKAVDPKTNDDLDRDTDPELEAEADAADLVAEDGLDREGLAEAE